MKLDRYRLIGFMLLGALLTIPIIMGRIPSMPRNTGPGFTEAISMTKHLSHFWAHEETLILFFMLIFLIPHFKRKIKAK